MPPDQTASIRSAATMEMPMETSVCRSGSPSQHQPDQSHDHKTRGDPDQPVAGASGDFVADIGAQEVKRPMREVHVLHQAKDQGQGRDEGFLGD